MAEDTLATTFSRLRAVIQPHLDSAHIKTDTAETLYLEVPGRKKPEMFAAVMQKKHYVSFHYQPVYVKPALVQDLSPELKRRMQGKSCFNFKRADDPAIDELETLVRSTAAAFLAGAPTAA